MRHPVLRNGLPLESCAFDRDEDSKTIHLAAYLENKAVGVLTLLPNSKDVQLRGMAVLTHHQGEGIGKQLLAKAEAHATALGCEPAIQQSQMKSGDITMKNSIFNGVITAAAFSLALGLSSHATAKQCPDQEAVDELATLSTEQARFGMIQLLDTAKTEKVIVAGFMVAIEKQDVQENIRAQNRAEALYQRHGASGALPALPPGTTHQVVAIAF